MATPKFAALKLSVHAACLAQVKQRITRARAGLEQAREAGAEESKSSAGDKHETARAMAHLELEKQLAVVNNLLEMEAALDRIDPVVKMHLIAPGALVGTDQGIYYIAAALGSVEAGDHKVQVVSVHAPLIAAMKDLTAGEAVVFRGTRFQVLQIA
ncbi:MAG: hypothetical protein JST38_00595 [Bacteroidetes bacterium]|nr:hypothetical protein [Bacteroidota bacterium]MBS1939363.1 hypothetical protein [Bacteroidota bacterium]